MDVECSGQHRYFVAQDASYNGDVFILLVCTACGGSKKVIFPIASKDSEVEVSQ
jgi:hypothetical protein